MSKWINWVTLFRNLIASIIFGLIVPYFLITNLDPNGILFDFNAVMLNGVIMVVVYSCYGIFKKELFIRFLIGCGWIILLIYFYTVGSNVFTSYLPNCGFGIFCVEGEIEDVKISFVFNYAWFVVVVLCLKGLNLFRHLVKPVEEKKYSYLTISQKFGI